MGKYRPEFTIWTKTEDRHVIRIELPRDPASGKRRRVSRTVRGTKRDAKRAARKMLMERDHGIDISPNKITLADWLTRWLKRRHGEGHIGYQIFERYEGIIQRHFIPSMGHVHLTELRADQIANLKDAWLTGDGSTAAAPLSPATVYKHLNVLRKSLADAVSSGIINHNPTDFVTAPSPKGLSEQRALDSDEIVQLLSACRETRYDAPVRLTLATGLRRGELLSLKWTDLDLDGKSLSCRGSKSANSRRTIELSASTVMLIRRHKQEQLERRLRLGPVWQEHGLVFPSTVGTPWLRRTFYRDYKKSVSKSDLSDPDTVKWHTLRHTAASQWIRRGVDIFTVSRRLGHASASFTMDVYAHLLKGQQRQAAEALDGLLAQV